MLAVLMSARFRKLAHGDDDASCFWSRDHNILFCWDSPQYETLLNFALTVSIAVFRFNALLWESLHFLLCALSSHDGRETRCLTNQWSWRWREWYCYVPEWCRIRCCVML